MFMSLCRRKLRSGASVQRSTCTGKSNHGDRGVAFYKMADLDLSSSHTFIHSHTHPGLWQPSLNLVDTFMVPNMWPSK